MGIFYFVNVSKNYKYHFLQEASRENKLRLLMILAAIYPEKFEGEKGLNLMKVATFYLIFFFLFHPLPPFLPSYSYRITTLFCSFRDLSSSRFLIMFLQTDALISFS